MVKFSPAPDVAQIGARITALYHRHLLECAVRVEYVFRDDVPKKLGKEVLGTARKISSLAAYLASEDEGGEGEPFFCITISYPWWERLTERQREALVDHELCHCWAEFATDDTGEPTDEVKLSLLAHEVEEFGAIVRRYGLWKSDLKTFGQIVEERQPSLDFAGR